MKSVQVTLPNISYQILIGAGLLKDAGSKIAEISVGKQEQLVLVSDWNVWGIYGETLAASLQDANIDYHTILIPAGEASKSISMLEQVYQEFAKAELGRNGLVVAFGGGVIGDLTGFAAATWMRGVDCLQIPTSLLAQVDSSVGGKTAIDLPSGKNLVGAFHQPRRVLADISVLSTLPAREFACGMAEVIKYGAIKSKDFFEQLTSPISAPPIEDIVETCCSIKRDIVQHDELDHGERALLNFGHTLGHAIEALGGYEQNNHGEAVAIGMVLAAKLGEKLGVTKVGSASALHETLTEWQLPTDCQYSAREIMQHINLDKKRQANTVKMVLLKDIGQSDVVNIELSEIKKLLEELL